MTVPEESGCMSAQGPVKSGRGDAPEINGSPGFLERKTLQQTRAE